MNAVDAFARLLKADGYLSGEDAQKAAKLLGTRIRSIGWLPVPIAELRTLISTGLREEAEALGVSSDQVSRVASKISNAIEGQGDRWIHGAGDERE